MKPPVVVDTNVPVVANSMAGQAGPECVIACIEALEEVCQGGRVLIDDRGLIMEEYQRNLSFAGQPGVGDQFFKWLWLNQWYAEVCGRVSVTLDADRGFVEFPDDHDLAGFDHDDRKFVAVAINSGENPPILNASDADWSDFHLPLTAAGVVVKFLCPELMS